MKSVKFDIAVGNPPYQTEIGDSPMAMPVYPQFMEETYRVARTVELITPARFLFNTGKTDKAWNAKMLTSKHLRVLGYISNNAKVFNGVDNRAGGFVITCWELDKEYEAIECFVPFQELNTILRKVLARGIVSLNIIMYAISSYTFTNKSGYSGAIPSNAFDRMPDVFLDRVSDTADYAVILGRQENQRVYRSIPKAYIHVPENFAYYKVFLSKGGHPLCDKPIPMIPPPCIGKPYEGHTCTFCSVGRFALESEAQACLKYIKTKFARILLGVLKTTQNTPMDAWRFVPLQDFTVKSDIDWSVTVSEIDKQLYLKYGFTDDEIAFVDAHLKEME